MWFAVESFSKLFDSYSREARVFPAVLVLVPVILFAFVAIPKTLLGEFPKNAVVLLAFFAVVYMLAGIARSVGKKTEAELIDSWGGLPTTMMLRHTDTKIDAVTKARYHRLLSEMCPDIVWPTAKDEAANATETDTIYGSAVAVLQARRRGEEHSLVRTENASYGYRRNMLGLRAGGITIALLAAIGAGALFSTQVLHIPFISAGLPKVLADPRNILLVVVSVAIAIVWAALVRPAWVREAADSYSLALLRSLDFAEA
jgi:hypothetical protein